MRFSRRCAIQIDVYLTLPAFVAVNCDQPYRELFVWAVFFGRIDLAVIFWQDCPDQLGSALVASLMLKSLAREATSAGKLHLAEELIANAGLVTILCCCFIITKLDV